MRLGARSTNSSSTASTRPCRCFAPSSAIRTSRTASTTSTGSRPFSRPNRRSTSEATGGSARHAAGAAGRHPAEGASCPARRAWPPRSPPAGLSASRGVANPGAEFHLFSGLRRIFRADVTPGQGGRRRFGARREGARATLPGRRVATPRRARPARRGAHGRPGRLRPDFQRPAASQTRAQIPSFQRPAADFPGGRHARTGSLDLVLRSPRSGRLQGAFQNTRLLPARSGASFATRRQRRQSS